MRHFKILRTFVGPFPMNRIVPESDFLAIPGCEISHLISNNSIEEVDVDVELTEEVLPVGPENPGEKFYPEVSNELPQETELVEESPEVVQEVSEVESVEEIQEVPVEEEVQETAPVTPRRKDKK